MNPLRHLTRAPIAVLVFLMMLFGADVRADDSTSGSSLESGGGSVAADSNLSVDQSAGVFRYSYGITLPKARGHVQPKIDLDYNSSAGTGSPGYGFKLSVPVIERRPPSGGFGPPTYGTGDRFALNGQLLVKICQVSGTVCSDLIGPESPDTTFPQGLSGYTYYRLAVEGSFVRLFLNGNLDGWVVQYKSGETAYFGGAGNDIDPVTGKVYRYNLAWRSDEAGTSATSFQGVNAIQYTWAPLGTRGLNFLTDIYMSPGNGTFAHRVHIAYATAENGYIYSSLPYFAPLWLAKPDMQISQISVWSASLSSATRTFVRAYNFTYGESLATPTSIGGFANTLKSIQFEGRCPSAIAESAGVESVTPTSCPTMPPTNFTYSQVSSTASGEVDMEPIQVPSGATPVLLDMNGDGLSDVVINTPNMLATGSQQAYINGANGVPGQFKEITYALSPTAIGTGQPWGTASFWGQATPDDMAFGSFPTQADHGVTANLLVPQYDSPGECWNLSAQTYLNEGVWNTTPVACPSGPSWPYDAMPWVTADYAPGGWFPAYTTYGDLNGDGILDSAMGPHVMMIPQNGWEPLSILGEDVNTYYYNSYEILGPVERYFSTKNLDGTVNPFASADVNGISSPLPAINTPSDPSYKTYPLAAPAHFLTDMNGDGIADYVLVLELGYANQDVSGSADDFVDHYWDWLYQTITGVRVVVFPGTGDGYDNPELAYDYTFSPSALGLPVETTKTNILNGANVSLAGTYPYLAAPTWLVADVTGDGYADFSIADANVNGVLVFPGIPLNATQTTFANTPITLSNIKNWNSSCTLQAADMDGSGTADLVTICNANGQVNIAYFPLGAGVSGNLMTGVNNDHGGVTTITYDTTSHLSLVAAANGSPWSSIIPQPMNVVTSTTTTNSLPGTKAQVITSAYTYQNPVFDGLRHTFRGFSDVSISAGGTGAGNLTVHTHYLVAPSYNFNNVACSPIGDCPADAVNSLPVLVETMAGGIYHSTVHTTYQVSTLHTGTDGYTVRYAYPEATDTFLYDTAAYTPALTTVSLPEIDSTATGASALSTTVGVPVRAAAAHLHKAQQSDANGNTIASTDFGRIDPGATDSPIFTSTPWSAYGASNWTWRRTGLTISGQGGVGGAGSRNLQWTFNAATARLQNEQVQLVGSTTATTLGRSNPSGGGTAPFPSNAAKDGWVTLNSNYGYDTYGNLTQVQGADGQCSVTEYDPLFGELPTVTIAYSAGKGCPGSVALGLELGLGPLVTSKTYDRGLGRVTSVTDPNSQLVSTTYDWAGRTLSVTQPTGTGGVLFGGTDSNTIAYDPINPFGPPVQFAQTTIGITPAYGLGGTPQTRTAWTMYDAYGATLTTFVQDDQPEAGCAGGTWDVAPLPDRDALGRVTTTYRPITFCGDPHTWNLAANQSNGMPITKTVAYDAFSRVATNYAADGTMTSAARYHALSNDTQDERQGAMTSGFVLFSTNWSTTTRNGHGQVVSTTRYGATPQGGSSVLQTHEVVFNYLPTGELSSAAELDPTNPTGPVISRTRQYDTMGRIVSTTEPNSGTWKYAYSPYGQLVATADPRGCGENIVYDGLLRVTSEDYSPCTAAQGYYNVGVDVLNTYDTPNTGLGGASIGRLSATADRAGYTRYQYDIRGRTSQVWKQLAAPAGSQSPYAETVYVKQYTYDDANEELSETTGANVADLYGATGQNTVSLTYSQRGDVLAVGGDYGPLITGRQTDADGFLLLQSYGDAAGTTMEQYPDARRRVSKRTTTRGAPSTWAAPTNAAYTRPVPNPAVPSTLTVPTVLQAATYSYSANQLAQVSDGRIAAEWPSGALPMSRSSSYDDFGRVTKIQYTAGSATGTDAFVSPLLLEQTEGDKSVIPFLQPATRVQSQSFQYDSLGNTTQLADDLNLFWDRSIGTIQNGGGPNAAGPNQLSSASNTNGSLVAAYEPGSGNLASLALTREGTTYQFRYDWDEVGNMQRARRWDGAALVTYPALPAATPVVDMTYVYDASHKRVEKRPTGETQVTAEIFSTLRLEDALWNGTNDYAPDATTEQVYLGAGGMMAGRVVYDTLLATNPKAALPSADGKAQHVYLELADHQGSTSTVIDRASGELVEKVTYQGFGQVESDDRPTRWQSFREQYRYTGKEDDLEVGLTYFGARYYSAPLGRWLSPDPLAVHKLGSDWNPYAYIRGRVMDATDPVGLDCEDDDDCETGEYPDYDPQTWAQIPNATTESCVGACQDPDATGGANGSGTDSGNNNGNVLPNGVAGGGDPGGGAGSVTAASNGGYTQSSGQGGSLGGVTMAGAAMVGVAVVVIGGPVGAALDEIGGAIAFGTGVGEATAVGTGTVAVVGVAVEEAPVAEGEGVDLANRAAPLFQSAATEIEVAAEGVTAEGLATVEQHLTNLGALDEPANAAMLERLQGGAMTPQDLNFYAHELYESGLMQGGDYSYDTARAAHLETLEWQGIPYAPGYESQLYHPDVISQFSESFNPAAWPK